MKPLVGHPGYYILEQKDLENIDWTRVKLEEDFYRASREVHKFAISRQVFQYGCDFDNEVKIIYFNPNIDKIFESSEFYQKLRNYENECWRKLNEYDKTIQNLKYEKTSDDYFKLPDDFAECWDD